MSPPPSRRSLALTVRCRDCGAAPRAPCRSPADNQRPPHSARWAEAVRLLQIAAREAREERDRARAELAGAKAQIAMMLAGEPV